MNWVLLRISRQVGWRWRRPQDKFGLWLLVYFREEVVLSDPSVIFLCTSISAILCARGGGGWGGGRGLVHWNKPKKNFYNLKSHHGHTKFGFYFIFLTFKSQVERLSCSYCPILLFVSCGGRTNHFKADGSHSSDSLYVAFVFINPITLFTFMFFSWNLSWKPACLNVAIPP